MGTISKVYSRDVASLDGLIYQASSGDLGNAVTRYIYIDMMKLGYLHFSLQHFITATTLTLEMCNNQFRPGQVITGVATSTDGTGATLVSSTLNSVRGFTTDSDLNGIQVRITKDTTTPANVGAVRTVVAYTGASGTMTLDSAFGATTSGVTEYQLEDNPLAFNRMVDDPPSTDWSDVTQNLLGVASATASGVWFLDTHLTIERARIKAVTTNVTNALKLRLTRGR